MMRKINVTLTEEMNNEDVSRVNLGGKDSRLCDSLTGITEV